MFSVRNPAGRLDAGDANYVECIHTNGPTVVLVGAGIGAPIGHADFFPNGGDSQPGCLTNTCSHGRAVDLYGIFFYNLHFILVLILSNLQLNRFKTIASMLFNAKAVTTSAQEDATSCLVHGWEEMISTSTRTYEDLSTWRLTETRHLVKEQCVHQLNKYFKTSNVIQVLEIPIFLSLNPIK